jgi:hypothetical protein
MSNSPTLTRRQLRDRERAAETAAHQTPSIPVPDNTRTSTHTAAVPQKKTEMQSNTVFAKPNEDHSNSVQKNLPTRRSRAEAERYAANTRRTHATRPVAKLRHQKRRSSFVEQTSSTLPLNSQRNPKTTIANAIHAQHRRLRTRKGLTLTAMTFAGGLMVTTSVPANALLSTEDVQALSYVAGKWTYLNEPTQSLESH